MKTILTPKEQEVFNACLAAEGHEYKGEVLIEDISIDMPRKVLRGYIGQLIKKGWMNTIEYSSTDITYVINH